jgi:hypothetical protein
MVERFADKNILLVKQPEKKGMDGPAAGLASQNLC